MGLDSIWRRVPAKMPERVPGERHVNMSWGRTGAGQRAKEASQVDMNGLLEVESAHWSKKTPHQEKQACAEDGETKEWREESQG